MFACQLGKEKKKKRFTEVQGGATSGFRSPPHHPVPAPPRPPGGEQTSETALANSRGPQGPPPPHTGVAAGTHPPPPPPHLPQTWERRPCSAACSPGARRETLPYTSSEPGPSEALGPSFPLVGARGARSGPQAGGCPAAAGTGAGTERAGGPSAAVRGARCAQSRPPTQPPRRGIGRRPRSASLPRGMSLLPPRGRARRGRGGAGGGGNAPQGDGRAGKGSGERSAAAQAPGGPALGADTPATPLGWSRGPTLGGRAGGEAEKGLPWRARGLTHFPSFPSSCEGRWKGAAPAAA